MENKTIEQIVNESYIDIEAISHSDKLEIYKISRTYAKQEAIAFSNWKDRYCSYSSYPGKWYIDTEERAGRYTNEELYNKYKEQNQ